MNYIWYISISFLILFLFVVKNAYYNFFRCVKDVGKINMSTEREVVRE